MWKNGAKNPAEVLLHYKEHCLIPLMSTSYRLSALKIVALVPALKHGLFPVEYTGFSVKHLIAPSMSVF